MGRPKGQRKPLTEEERSRVEEAAATVELAARDVQGCLLQLAVELARLGRALDTVPALRPPPGTLLTPPGAAYLMRYEELRQQELRRVGRSANPRA